MEIKRYISSGNLEQHCFDLFNGKRARKIEELRLAYPEIRHELGRIEQAIELLAESQAIEPNPKIRQRLLDALGFANVEQLDINHLPSTSKYSDHKSWLNTVKHLIPAEPVEDFHMEVLQQTGLIDQMLVITKLDVPPEIHEEVMESFFILKGQCACTVGNDIFTLNPGDHLNIPLHVSHDIKILSPYVIAILQHQFV